MKITANLSLSWQIAGFFFFALITTTSAWADGPRIPTNDDEVLDVLPRSLSLNRDRMGEIRGKLTADPENVDLATAAARGYMKMGDEEGDPRFYGYAHAAIEHWWDDELPPAPIVKVRAKLKEKNHDYQGALDDLERLLEKEPHDIQALIEVINLYRVKGNFKQAWAAWHQLDEFADEIPSTVSRVPLMAENGHAEEAYELLTKRLETARESTPELVPWIITTQARLAQQLGKIELADTHFRDAIKLTPDSIRLRRAYAELLLDHGRTRPVLKLLQDKSNDNGTLLLLAIASKRLGLDSMSGKWKKQLETRFEEIRLRGDEPHARFEARFELELDGNPQRALEIALKNWEKQKETRDARIVLEAALATKNLDAARPVLVFIRDNDVEDVVLKALIKQMRKLK